MNKEVKKYVSDELGKLLMNNETSEKIYWHIWGVINKLTIDKKIDVLGYRVLMDKLVAFTQYITFA